MGFDELLRGAAHGLGKGPFALTAKFFDTGIELIRELDLSAYHHFDGTSK